MPVTPTAEQAAIVNANEPVVMVEAVAGAGKTTVLAWALKRACQQGIAPDRVIALCFSGGAKERFKQKFAEEGTPKGIVVQTVEEFARDQILHLVQAGYLDQPLFYTTDEQIRPHIVAAAQAVWEAYERRGIRCDFDFSFDNNARVEEFVRLLVRLKATLATLIFDEQDADEIADALDASKEIMEICKAYERFRCPDAGEFLWQSRFDHVTDLVAMLRRQPHAIDALPSYRLCVVDEWHDVNAAEFELVQVIARRARLIVVGDRDQTINSERGADPAFSGNGFDFAFPKARRYPLSQTFRFGSGLSKLVTLMMHKPCASFEGLRTKMHRQPYDLAKENDCAAQVRAHIKTLDERGGVKLNDVAVVVRDPDQSIDIENLLIDDEIPYRCSGFDSYLVRPEILMLRGLLHIATGRYDTLVGDKDTCAKLVRSLGLYASARFDSDEEFASLHAADQSLTPEKKNERRWQEAERMIANEPSTLDFFFSGVLCRKSGIDTATTKRWKTRFADVVGQLKEMVKDNSAAQLLAYAAEELDLASATSRIFVSRSKADSATRSINSFIGFAMRQKAMPAERFLEELAARQKKIGKKLNYLKSRAQLELTTVQHAKGKEWPHVLIPYLERGQFPRTANIAEERRLLYVAMTRAIASLTFFEPGESHEGMRSVLLTEIAGR